MKKRVCFVCWALVTIMLSLVSFEVWAEETKNVFADVFAKGAKPVLLKYIAEENRCSVEVDKQDKIATVIDKNGVALKTYEDIALLNGRPVIDSGIIESDFGWTAALHVPNTDMFDFEADAVVAGAFTYLTKSRNGEFTYIVGRCYHGWYFSETYGEHEKKCPHNSTKSLIYEIEITLRDGVPDYDFSDAIETQVNEEEQGAVFAETVNNSLSDKDLKPVLLEYILRERGYKYTYSKEGEKVYVYNKEGGLLTSFRGVPSLYGCIAVDAAALKRVGIESDHKPNTELFARVEDAITAGWLTYYRESEKGEFTFYVGNCYGGYYFSPLAGEHLAGCEHSVNASMFFEYPVLLKNGALEYEEHQRDINDEGFGEFAQKSRRVTNDEPTEALTKMVTLMHTEYAKKEGVQSIYFSYRDRVYRDYWEDVSNYDVTDYIFIPPDFPQLENYGDFNASAAEDMAKAIRALLARDGTVKIWVGTPGITSNNYRYQSITADTAADFLKEVRRRLGVEAWEKSVVGVYVNQESVYPEKERAQIDRMKEIVRLAKKTDSAKKSLWIPYYDLDEGEELSGIIAEVSRIPNLFDYIIIQPGYFFFENTDEGLNPDATAHRRQNLDAVSLSAEYNYVSNTQGKPVSGGETSYAAIGFEMEPQASYFSNSRDTRDESLDRYTEYLLAGARIKQAGPMAFYASGDPHCNLETLVYKFYGADELNAKAVRKKLDSSLDGFYSYVFETREKEKTFYEYAKALYLSANPGNTEDSFQKIYDANVIIPEFYRYEKKTNAACEGDIGDIEQYIIENGSLPEEFDEIILNLLK